MFTESGSPEGTNMTGDNRIDEIEARLSRLEAKDEIMTLAIRYGEVVDKQLEQELRGLFTSDARWAWGEREDRCPGH